MSIRKLLVVILSNAKNLCERANTEILRRLVYPGPAEGLLRMTADKGSVRMEMSSFSGKS